MYRQNLVKAVRPAIRPTQQCRVSVAPFSTTTRAMGAGDTGAPRAAGSLHPSDAFAKREQANENYSIRMREKEKLLELKKRLQEQHAQLQELEDHIDELTATHGSKAGEGSKGGEQK